MTTKKNYNIFVYYQYDYCEMGGHGFEMFERVRDAEEFIKNIAIKNKMTEEEINRNFTFIVGEIKGIRVKEIVKEIEIEDVSK